MTIKNIDHIVDRYHSTKSIWIYCFSVIYPVGEYTTRICMKCCEIWSRRLVLGESVRTSWRIGWVRVASLGLNLTLRKIAIWLSKNCQKLSFFSQKLPGGSDDDISGLHCMMPQKIGFTHKNIYLESTMYNLKECFSSFQMYFYHLITKTIFTFAITSDHLYAWMLPSPELRTNTIQL